MNKEQMEDKLQELYEEVEYLLLDMDKVISKPTKELIQKQIDKLESKISEYENLLEN